MSIHICKGDQPHYSSGKCKFKSPLNTALYPSEWLIVKQLNIGEDVEQLEMSYIIDGGQIGTTTLENSWKVSTKAEYIHNYDPAILLLGIYSTEMNTCDHKKTLKMFLVIVAIIIKI